MKKNRRSIKNILIEPRFQKRFVAFLALYIFFPTLGTSIVLFQFLRTEMAGIADIAKTHPETYIAIEGAMQIIPICFAIAFLILFLELVVVGVIFSHRIAGAIFVLKRCFQAVARGESPTMRLRDNDEFQEVAESFNQMSQSLVDRGFQKATNE